MMTPTPSALRIVAFVAADSLTENVSLFSFTRSPTTITLTVLVVSPGANVNVPDVD